MKIAETVLALLLLPALGLARPGEIEAQDPSEAVIEATTPRIELKPRGVDAEPAARKPCPNARPRKNDVSNGARTTARANAGASTPSPTSKVTAPTWKVHPEAEPAPAASKPGCPYVLHTAPAAGELLDDPSLGTRSSPVLCGKEPGARAYLSRLRCHGGQAPTFERLGSSYAGGDGHRLDVYQVSCSRGANTMVLMDTYHLGYVETRAIDGFTLAAP